MDEKVFQSIRRIVHEQSGIDLKQGKAAMVAARISRRLRELELDSVEAYVRLLKDDADEIVQLLNVISTNVTRFFREKPHFPFLDQTVTRWLEEGQQQLRIWSAASSTGEEPYSVAMTVNEAMRRTGKPCDFRMLATDISTRVLDHARAGRYETRQVEAIPDDLIKRYFRKTPGSQEPGYEVIQSLREQILFSRLNLNNPPFPMRGPFDLVFCCNVMIYFDANTKRRLLEQIHRLLKPDGYLIVSHTESLTGLTDMFRPLQPSIYTPTPGRTGLGAGMAVGAGAGGGETGGGG